MSSRTIAIGLLVSATLIVGGCRDRRPKTATRPPGSAPADGHAHDHAHDHAPDHPHEGPRHALGTKNTAGYVISVTQIGDAVKPNNKATFEIKVKPAAKSSATMPKVVRAWLGNDRAEGVPKVRAPWRPKPKYFDADLETGKLPAESQLWVELETDIDKHFIPFDFKEK